MADIFELSKSGRPSKPNKVVIDLLEKVLENAKKGFITSVAVVGSSDAGDIATGWASSGNVIAMIGGMAVLKQDIILKEIE